MHRNRKESGSVGVQENVGKGIEIKFELRWVGDFLVESAKESAKF